MFNNLLKRFSNDIGIDLGTTNTLVYLSGSGIVINEPSVVAVNTKTGKIVALGKEAKNMMGRTPEHINVIRPIIDGVISDYEVTEEFLSYLINKANNINKKFLGPRVVVGIPIGITDVEVRAVEDAATTAGAREVFIIEEPAAAAIGMGVSIHTPTGSLIVDIGGGTSDIAILSLSGIVKRKSLKIAGDKMNQDIIAYIKNKYKILIGEKTAEEIKIEIGSVLPDEDGMIREMSVKGRDLTTGLPKEIIVNEEDIRLAMYPSIAAIIDVTKELLEVSPPEVLSDILRDGIILTGGGALTRNISTLFEMQLKVKTIISPNPLTDVASGCGIVLHNLNKFDDLLIKSANDIAFVK